MCPCIITRFFKVGRLMFLHGNLCPGKVDISEWQTKEPGELLEISRKSAVSTIGWFLRSATSRGKQVGCNPRRLFPGAPFLFSKSIQGQYFSRLWFLVGPSDTSEIRGRNTSPNGSRHAQDQWLNCDRRRRRDRDAIDRK